MAKVSPTSTAAAVQQMTPQDVSNMIAKNMVSSEATKMLSKAISQARPQMDQMMKSKKQES